MRKNYEKEHTIFQRNPQKNIILENFQEIDSVIEQINNIKNNKEELYIFNSGVKADFLYERSCVNDLSFNYLQIYNKNVHSCVRKISQDIKTMCESYQISMSKNMFFITSDYELDFSEDFWYDTGGTKIPSFSGYWFLETKEDAFISIEDKDIDVMPGKIVCFEASRKTIFKNVESAISFNVTTLSKLEGQYPQKWMPIIIN